MTLLQPPVLAPTTLPDIEIAAKPAPIKPQRLLSLDVFRGLTIAAMILVNNMAEPKYVPLEHAEWHGWTPTDLIFPFFLFIVGVAIPFSFARRSTTTEQTRGQMLARVWLRALSLWMLGQLLFAFPMPRAEALPAGFAGYKALRIFCFIFVWGGIVALLFPWRTRRLQTIVPLAVAFGFYALMVGMHYATKHAQDAGLTQLGGGIFNPDNLRIPGVLQRIGLVYGFAGTIALLGGWRTIAAAIVVLCALYSALMLKVPYGPEHTAGSLTFENNLARHVDEKVFDRYTLDADGKRVYTQRHTYRVYPDNEGLLSTIPAIATSLLGVLLGLWLMSGRSTVERCAGMLAMGVPAVVLGYLLNWWLMPINKILWTPSYVFFTAGLAMLGLGFLFWVIDVLGYRRWSWPAVVFGMNAIAAYVAASIVPRLLNLIKLPKPGGSGPDDKVGLYAMIHNQWSLGLRHTLDWITSHAHTIPLAKPENMHLGEAACLIVVVWVIMLVMYVSKIFLKI